MRETILIIMFLTIISVFIFVHSSEVSFQESFVDNEHYLVRNLDFKCDNGLATYACFIELLFIKSSSE